MSSVISLIISRSTGVDDTTFKELNSLNGFQPSGHVTEHLRDNQTANGIIDNNGVSYLSLVWEYPDSTNAGLYRCEANGVDDAGHPVSINSTVFVSSSYPDVSVLVSELKKMNSVIELFNQTMTTKLEDLNQAFRAVNVYHQTWDTRMEFAKKFIFKNWTVFNNHQYLLSYPRSIINIEDFQAVCEVFGGYLVEIDSIAEFTYLHNFISSFSEFLSVKTGATDEAEENHWVYLHSGTVFNDIQWAQDQPNEGRLNNCMSFHRLRNWYLTDDPCHAVTQTFENGFICEIPH
ncbi:uncharacterized protein LOC131957989 [Physella acuta]|uniref:uncharacterized protein LOC131957989 n=1 Tax=Physella acuta TaxID=109671 RepID=UPI0027DC69B6|nr:uncharacterized protein LOC131957989 [Physella acuta]